MESKLIYKYYYILVQKDVQGNAEFVLVDNSTPIEIIGWEDYDFFITHYKEDKYKSFWIMSEGKTGLRMFERQTRKNLLQTARYGLKKITKKYLNGLIKYYIEQYGMSPRYEIK